MKKIGLLLISIIILIGSLNAAVFGIEFGWNEEDIKDTGIKIVDRYDFQDGTIGIEFIPLKKHSAFNQYSAYIDFEYGVYQIIAENREIKTSGRGTEVKDLYDKTKTQLSMTYGEPIVFDFLTKGSIWDRPQDFMLGLYYGDRVLYSFFCPTNSNVDLIYLEAEAYSKDVGGMNLIYFGNNAQEVKTRIEEDEASLL